MIEILVLDMIMDVYVDIKTIVVIKRMLEIIINKERYYGNLRCSFINLRSYFF